LKIGTYVGSAALIVSFAITSGLICWWFKKGELDQQERRAKYGLLWDGFDMYRLSASLYHAVFLLRRLIFAAVCVFVGLTYGGLVLVLVTEISLCV
jgi:hypothetical protein